MKPRWLGPLVLIVVAGCDEPVPEPDPPKKAPEAQEKADPGPKELLKEDLKVGTGPVAESGDTVKVHYTGRLLKTNFKFDSSEGKDPFEFTIGAGSVIKGWDQGVVGMKVGGKRKLTIPADLAYGETGSPPKIPPNAPLVFEIELLSIEGKTDADAAPSASAER